jgi:hypothetical protein
MLPAKFYLTRFLKFTSGAGIGPDGNDKDFFK